MVRAGTLHSEADTRRVLYPLECRDPRKVFFCLTGPYLTGRATIGRLELPPGEGRFVGPPLRAAPPRITAYTARGSSD